MDALVNTHMDALVDTPVDLPTQIHILNPLIVTPVVSLVLVRVSPVLILPAEDPEPRVSAAAVAGVVDTLPMTLIVLRGLYFLEPILPYQG